MQIPARDPRESGRDYALRCLTENIVSLELAPGSMVSENELAAQLGLSRTPVREALMALAKVRLVDVYPQRGSAVALVDYDLVEETCFMRRVFEVAVVEVAAKTASEADKVALMDNVQAQERFLQEGRPDQLLPLDNELHKMLFMIARKSQMWDMMSSYTLHFDRVRRMALDPVRNDRNVADHRAIVEAVCAGDAAQARKLMDRHLNRYKVDENALRERYPENWFK